MRDKAIVVEILEEGKIATVVPMITDACISCKSPCAKRGKPFAVSNRNGFSLENGLLVKIGAPLSVQIFQAIVAIFFPTLCAVLGYIFCPIFLHRSPDLVSEDTRIFFVLIFFAISAILVFIFSRNSRKTRKSEIIEVYG